MYQNVNPNVITSAGTGSGGLINPTITPRSNTKVSPLTGALLGTAIGYLTTPDGKSPTGGVTLKGIGDAAMNLFRGINVGLGGSPFVKDSPYTYGDWANPNYTKEAVKDAFKKEDDYVNSNNLGGFTSNFDQDFRKNPFAGNDNSSSLTEPDISYGFDGNSYDNAYEDAYDYKDGGMATPLMAEGGEVPHYYTYGKAIDPSEILKMAQGGQPKGGLPTHVPTVNGRHDYRSGSRVTGEGTGQSDDIPAMLADGEYVFDADTVAALGDGSTKAGSDILDKFREELRAHKRSAPINKIPPPAKSPLAYLKAARSKK
jgi:hypothetical protein